MNKFRNRRQPGFTIVELLVAMAVFSVIVLVMTAAVLQFSRQYYRGVIASSTQDAARTIIDDITRSMEFNSGDVYGIGSDTGYCIGSTKRLSYKLFQQVTDTSPAPTRHQGYHGLVSDTYNGCSTSGSPALDVATLNTLTTQNARELLGQNMRLAKLDIESSGELYIITVKVVYGDDAVLTNPTDPETKCKSGAGSQFCAASELTTTVQKRIISD